MQDIRSAVTQVLATEGPAVLSVPSRFSGALSDIVGTDARGMNVLLSCCDAAWLAPFGRALEAHDVRALCDATAAGTERLASVYRVDARLAYELSNEVALGVADYAGMVMPTQAAAGQGGADSAMGAPDGLEQRVGSGAPQMTSNAAGWPSDVVGPSYPESTAPAPRKRSILPIVALVLVLVAGCVGAVVLLRPDLFGRSSDQAAATRRYVIRATVKAPGLDAEGSRIPVHVAGTTELGEALDEHQWIDWQGDGLELPPGSYVLTLDSSPIAGDGTVYEAEDVAIPVEVSTPGEDQGNGQGNTTGTPSTENETPIGTTPVDTEPSVTVEEPGIGFGLVIVIDLNPLPWKQVTQDLLDDIVGWVGKDPSMQPDKLTRIANAAQGALDNEVNGSPTPTSPTTDEVPALEPGLVYLSFDGGYENAFDGSVAKASGNVVLGVGISGQAAHFDGYNGYLDLGNGYNLQGDFSCTMWLRPDEGNADRSDAGLLAKYEVNGYGPYDFYLNYNRPAYWVSDGKGGEEDVSSSQTLPTDAWSMVTYVYDADAATLSIYVNGQLDSNHEVREPLEGRDTVTVGRQALLFHDATHTERDLQYQGYIDELYLLDYALDEGTIAQLYDAGRVAAAEDAIGGANRAEYTGTLRILTAEQVLELQGQQEMYGSVDAGQRNARYAVLVFDTPQVVRAADSGNYPNVIEREASMLCLAIEGHKSSGDFAAWEPYDGTAVTVSIETGKTLFPSDARLPLGEPYTSSAELVR